MSLLPPQDPRDVGKKCLVLDLDETLVHSSFKPIPKPEYIIPVEIDGMVHHVYVRKRPGCDTFLRMMARHYEIVIFTASLSKYANPLLDKLDPYNYIRSRLYREHCTFHMVRTKGMHSGSPPPIPSPLHPPLHLARFGVLVADCVADCVGGLCGLCGLCWLFCGLLVCGCAGKLREGHDSPWAAHRGLHHRGQLPRVVPVPARERHPLRVLHREPCRPRAAGDDPFPRVHRGGACECSCAHLCTCHEPRRAIPFAALVADLCVCILAVVLCFVQDVRTVLHQWCSPGPGTILGPGPVSPPGDGSDSKSDPN